MEYMTVGLKRKVSLALLPVDDFTGKIIQGSLLRVYLKEENVSSIRKQDGYHVFCDLSGNEAEVCLESPLYQKQIIKLPIGQEKPNVHIVRMLPGISYPLPQGTTIINGALPKSSVLRLFIPVQKRGCKLLGDYDPDMQGAELSLFSPSRMSFMGKTMCICDKDKNYEFFRITDQKGNICTLEHPLSKVYQKRDSSIYPVYEITGGEDGSFYLPISGLTGEAVCVCILMRAGKEEKTCEMTLVTGRENRITEDIWKGEI